MKLKLSAHERRIHDLMLADISAKEIGEIIGKPEKLVQRVGHTIYAKLDCRNGRYSLMAAEIARLSGKTKAEAA